MRIPSLLVLLTAVTACSSSSNDSSSAPTSGSGGTASGGSGTSGGSNGGSGTGGGSNGGSSNGGGSNGGSSNGGSSNGGDTGTGGAGSGGLVGTSLTDRLGTKDVTTPEGVKAGVRNFRVWGQKSLQVAPVYTAPLSDCGTLVCYTTDASGTPTARAAHLGPDDTLLETFTLGANLDCRGLAAEPDGHFGALLWDDANDKIYVARFDAQGNQLFSTELTNSDNHPDDFGIGEGRLDYGGGKYGAYYHVHSDSGHEGDTLKWVTADTGTESTEWGWGCSHSMSEVLRYNDAVSTFLPACVTDCYPGTNGDFSTMSQGGLYLNHDDAKILDVDGACNGSVAGELGSGAPSPDGWKVVFNAHQNPMTLGQQSYDSSTMNQDIGFSSVTGASYQPGAVVWLTTTPENEENSSIAKFSPSGDTAEQYVVGWSERTTPAVFKLARVDAAGAFLEQPVDVTSTAKWGNRDDPFRTHANGDVIWAWFDAAGSTTLHVARVKSGTACAVK
ncbi:MAG TPA: hypothetical protein VHE30_22830 [Polyangiaceae bacterium]|nr:hypothetical protein [Polyangiaceae bacterium]